MKRLALSLLALAALTACERPAHSPIPCTGGTIAGAEVDDDSAFREWIAAQARPVDYTPSGFWYDAHGVTLGWSSQEDSTICLTGYTA